MPNVFAKSARLVVLLAIPFLAACSNTIQPARVAQFEQAANTVHTQTQTTFKAINEFITYDEINRAIKQKDITEEDLAVILKPDDIAKWENTFTAVDNYCKSLDALLDPSHAQDVQQSVVNAATELKTLDKNALPDPAISAAFTTVAGFLVEAKAQSDALRIAREADPAMQSVFTTMAHAIGTPTTPGLYKTITLHWADRLAVKQDEFHRRYTDFHKNASPSKDEQAAFEASQRPLVLEFISLRDQRDAQLLSLASLRKSILGLAEAHGALARGSAPDLSAILAQLQGELDNAKSLYSQFQALKPAK